MTAEIAILNAAGVAIAADSAVTLQSNNSPEKKIYNSSNKVFSLSKFYPVGIMIYGNALFLSLPWETIIKKYRNHLWKRSFETLFEYAQDFLTFLEQIIPDKVQQKYFEHNISMYYLLIREDIKKEVESITSKEGKISLTRIRKTITTTIKGHLTRLVSKKDLPKAPENFDKNLLVNHENLINGVIDKVFEKLPITSANRKILQEIACVLYKKDLFPTNISGVVIAGYGEKEDFPSLVEIIVDNVIDNVVKYKINRRVSVTYDSGAVIVPFAQNEMVCTFMEGINPLYRELMQGILDQIIDDYPKLLLEKIYQDAPDKKQQMLGVLSKVSSKARSDINNKLQEYQQKTFILPVLSAVGALPKDELAVMAETLVNLTSFKRKMSLDAETVGGPIDVALISKGDGFIWIKRKHYFNPELNHQFFTNYYLSTNEEEK